MALIFEVVSELGTESRFVCLSNPDEASGGCIDLDESDLIDMLAAIRDDESLAADPADCPRCDGDQFPCSEHAQARRDDAADDAASMHREADET